ncbi:MAG TPA: tetratricopeptide repeat protein [Nitrososphaeraceae archaeon]
MDQSINPTQTATVSSKIGDELLVKILVDEWEQKPILDFESYCQTLLNIVKDSEPNFSVGIYGEWGTGKTSLMRLIEDKLRCNSNGVILTVWFNPWRYEREKEFALIALMKSLAFAMGDHPIYGGIKPLLLSGIKIVGIDLLRKFASKYLLTEKGIEEFEKKIRPKAEILSEIVDKDTIYYDGFKKIESEMGRIIGQYPNSKVVVFVDDLDRCSPKTMLEVFESMKIFLGMSGFVYIVGLSYETITRFISAEYANILLSGTKRDVDDTEYIRKMGEQYIRKIIQIPIDLPPWGSDDVESLIDNLSKKLGKPYSSIVSRNISLIAKAVERNPREVKRYINSFIVSYQLFSSIVSPTNNKVEITPEQEKQLLIVLSLRVRWKSFYNIFSSYDYFRQEIKKYLKLSDIERGKLFEKSESPQGHAKILSDILPDFELWQFLIDEQSTIYSIDWSLFRRAIRSGTEKEFGKSVIEPISRGYEQLIREAQDLYNTGQYNAALKIIEQALKKEPKSAEAWNEKGLNLDKLTKYEEAIKCYDEAIKSDTKMVYPWYNKGLSYDALGNFEEAIKCYDEAIKLDPNYAEPWNGKGYAMEALKKYEEAIKCYDEAIKLDRSNVYAWNRKGKNLDNMKKYEEAIKCYDEVININPNHAGAWNSKGADLYSLKKYNEALQCYDEAIKLDPNYADAWYNRGLIFSKWQNEEEASRSYERSRRISSKIEVY